jgi:hypothetical protein
MRLLVDDLGAFRISQFGIVNPHVKRLDGESALVRFERGHANLVFTSTWRPGQSPDSAPGRSCSHSPRKPRA